MSDADDTLPMSKRMENLAREFGDRALMREAVKLRKQEQEAKSTLVGTATLKHHGGRWFQKTAVGWVAVGQLDDLILDEQ
jgi:hypothetical protein